MRTPLCDDLGIEFPIFAFTHCRDVVVAVAKAGGFGVLGAVGFSPEQLEIELQWIDEHIGDRPYGVDIVIPNKYEGMDTQHVGRRARRDAAQDGAAGEPRLRPQAARRPRRPGPGRERGQLAQAPRLDRGHRHAAGRGRAAAPEDDADRERARDPAGRGHGPHPRRGPQGRGALRLAVPGAQARRRRASTSSSPRAARAAATAARSARSSCGRRSSRRSRRSPCSPPAGSAAARRSPPRSRSAARARGRARSG